MAERLKAPVLKTGKGATLSWVRIPVLPPFDLFSIFKMYNYHYFYLKGEKMTDRVCINLSYAVPNEKAAEVENIFSTHGKWMTEFYSDGTDHLLNAYFTKAPEFKDPTDPSKGETGNTLFTINEQFASMESVQRHVENASKNDYFPDFAKLLDDYGKVLSMGGSVYVSIR